MKEKETFKKVSIDFVDDILLIVSSYTGFTVQELLEKTRKREIVEARQLAMAFSKEFTSGSLASIGFKIGRKDHATVLHACKVVNNLTETSTAYRRVYNTIKNAIFDKLKKRDISGYFCAKCGSNKVQVRSWVYANSRRVVNLVIDDLNNDPLDNWCDDCNNHTEIVTDMQFQEEVNKAAEERLQTLEKLDEENNRREKAILEKIDSKREYNEQLKRLEKELGI